LSLLGECNPTKAKQQIEPVIHWLCFLHCSRFAVRSVTLRCQASARYAAHRAAATEVSLNRRSAGMLISYSIRKGVDRLYAQARARMGFTPAGDLLGRVLLQSREVPEGRRPRLD
jgi:hypothetical protein